MQNTASSADLTWLLDDLVARTSEAKHGIVLSTDGLLLATSRDLTTADAEHLSAVAAGIQSLAKGVSERFGGGSVRQTIIEMRQAYLLVTVAGQGACLAVLCGQDADVGLVAYEMAMLVTRVGQYLSSPARGGYDPGHGEGRR
ncbi:putative regulator of Ras-like GTPase activity (Roadblock/LC7/MglB family) [Thermocatellispora tengchongensis]|uniref:Putative regulator of Ras-like GTPase activity (Roadblock/LC7/MglB family) n=1 Tax=Thermocatellispora tengchongensis TaxID=1073253 RepID=A0A840PA11_9ACTN|nr:putative regulator of Ras-like GTPase activity (Roadblock/LC7/MglB family) [Thermocatellispora tengchongensis]